MDCKDLMIGDFVYVARGYDKHLTIEKVKGIIADKDEPYPVTISTGETVSLNDIKPIPLTSDILVKNGFIFNKGYAVLQVSEDTCLDFYKHEHRLRKVWKGIDEWNNHAKVRDVTFVCQCYYVHEFQHALRLAGVQKEIEL